jgi:plasmid stabilization system protein ParE
VSARPIVFHPAALADALEAKAFYRERDGDAALAFEELLSIALDRIEASPERWAPYAGGTRRYLLPRYPYALVYEVRMDDVRILAVAHQRRRPGYWIGRRHD